MSICSTGQSDAVENLIWLSGKQYIGNMIVKKREWIHSHVAARVTNSNFVFAGTVLLVVSEINISEHWQVALWNEPRSLPDVP